MLLRKFFDSSHVQAFCGELAGEMARERPPSQTNQDSLGHSSKRLDEWIARKLEELNRFPGLNIYQKAKLGTILQETLEAAGYPAKFAKSFSYELVKRTARTESDSKSTDAPAQLGPLQLYLTGHFSEAEQEARRRLEIDKTDPDCLCVEGLLALERKQLPAALTILERLNQESPNHVEGWLGLSRAYAMAGRRKASSQALQRAQQLKPHHPEVLTELALAAVAAGKEEDTTQLLEKATGGVRCAEAHFQLGNLLLQRQRMDDAARHFRQAAEANPAHASAHANLGAVLRDQGFLHEAANHLEQAVQLDPSLGQPAYNLAVMRVDGRDWDAAVELLRASLRAEPRQADAQYWLGNALMGKGEADQAREAYQAALRIQGNHVRARWGLAMAQLPAVAASPTEQSQAAAAFAAELEKLKTWLRTRQPSDGYLAVGAQQPFYLAYVEQDHRKVLGEYGSLCSSLIARWARKVDVPPPVRASVSAKLRVGIVSAHVQSHSVWHAIVRGWVEHLDRSRFELHLFHVGQGRDEESQWASKQVARMHQGLGDWPSWAKAISDGQFDILIYPEIGMDATTTRLAALRLARVQLASWGHPITTGLPTIDAFVSAQAFEPKGASSHYTEKLIALPRLGCSYGAHATKPERVDLAAWGIGAADHVLLCTGHSMKYSPRDDALMIELARRCAPCKLVFFRNSGDARPALLEHRMRTAFEEAGLNFDQHVRFVHWQSQAAFFGLLQQADVFLDSVGFSGFNTAMQAVQCGTPIVAWEGAYMRGRFASGILRQMGLDDWVARSPEEFIQRAERLCMDPAVRKRLREQIAQRGRALFNDKATVDAFAVHLQELAQTS